MSRRIKNILAIPFLPHLEHFYKGLVEDSKIEVLAFSRNSRAARRFPYKHIRPLHTFMIPPDLSKNLSAVGINTHVPLYITSFTKIVKNSKPDVLLVFDFYHWYTLQSLRYQKKNPEVPLVIYSETRCWPKNKLSRLVMYWFFWYLKRHQSAISKVIVYTEGGRKWWKIHAPDVSVAIIPAPVDGELFVSSEQKVWLPSDTLRIIMNARYIPLKRHQDLFEAVQAITSLGKRCTITLIAQGNSGRPVIKQMVEAYGLSQIVQFAEPKPMAELTPLYHQHDVLVLPSNKEAIGMVVPEAMGCGLPTITSDAVGANVYVEPGVTGYIFPSEDVKALQACLLDCYDKTKLAYMGQVGAKRVQEKYTISVVAKQFLRELDSLS